jgi:hypothetical protein
MFRRIATTLAQSSTRTFASDAAAVDARVVTFLETLKIDTKHAKALGDWESCLRVRTEELKKIGLSVKQRKNFLRFTERTRKLLFDPFAEAYEGK